MANRLATREEEQLAGRSLQLRSVINLLGT